MEMNDRNLDPVIDPPLYGMPNDKRVVQERDRIQRLLNFGPVPNAYADEVSARVLRYFLPTRVGAMTGVNRLGIEEQFFVGHAKVGEDGKIFHPEKRTMDRGAGYCEYLGAGRKLGLPLNNLLEIPQFSSNPVVDAGIRAYNGQPLLTPEGLEYLDGTPVPANFVFGTVFIVSPQEEEWTKDDVAWLKVIATEYRDHVVALHRQRL